MAVVGWDHGRKKTLTIPSSAQESDVLNMGSLGTFASYNLGILTPDALTGVVTLEVSDKPEGPFRPYQSDNVDITLTADKGMSLDPVPFPYLRFASSLAEAADRDIVMIAHRT